MFKLPVIDFSKNSFLDVEVLDFHYGKHHRGYVEKLNKLLKQGGNKRLTEIIESSSGEIYNNAAQVFSHTYYWLCLTPQKSSIQNDSLFFARIEAQFGSLTNLRIDFLNKAMSLFGVGWTWLVLDRAIGNLEILNTQNADIPSLTQFMPLMVCDLWEHAYYIDYRNSRANYLNDFWEAVNWKFVSENFELKDLKRIEDMISG